MQLKTTTCSFLLVFVVSTMSGCGGSNHREELSDEQKVSSTIMAVADSAGSEETLKAVFASGSVPDNAEDYATCMYEVVGEPDVSGDSATATVKVTTGMADSSKGDSVKNDNATRETREVTWKLTKSDGEWKLSDAPIQ